MNIILCSAAASFIAPPPPPTPSYVNVLEYSINEQYELCYAIKQILVNSGDDEPIFAHAKGTRMSAHFSWLQCDL